MPTYMIGFVIFKNTDFKYKEQMSTDGNTRVLKIFNLIENLFLIQKNLDQSLGS